MLPVKIGPMARQPSTIIPCIARAKCAPIARNYIQNTVRCNSSRPNHLPLVPTRRFRSNAPGQAAVAGYPLFTQRSIPEPEREEEPEPEPSPKKYHSLDNVHKPGLPVYEYEDRPSYWQTIPRWRNVSQNEFLTQKFQTCNTMTTLPKLQGLLMEVLPAVIPEHPDFPGITTREAFIEDVVKGIEIAPMTIRLPPHILSRIQWSNPLVDPIRRQFIPMKSSILPDHEKLELDSLHEYDDSPVDGLVHRYHDKALFLATSVCPLYCRFCTRAWSVGSDTNTVSKTTFKPQRQRWQRMFEYIEATPQLQDIVVSGGDCYMLSAENLREIGQRLISIPHIKRFRFATKGLAVSPSRILDESDPWAAEMIRLSQLAKEEGKSMAIHTHFNHPRELTWVSSLALQKLHVNNVTVRNQSVVLRGVNDDVPTMKALIRKLADNNVVPYYVYQADMTRGVEDLRTPLSVIHNLERNIRGFIAGYLTPSFVIDLPGGGGKRLANSFDSYDKTTGRSTFTAPSVTGHAGDKQNKVYEYWDPKHSLPGYRR